MSDVSNPDDAKQEWKPIGKRLRRILGVLVEKAKTTPDNYPLSVSSLVAGCNQKSNRDPLMQLNEDDVTEALESLRALGAVREVQGSGRVSKFRHSAYEWLGVSGQQAAIMTELMLRGPQTAGELRARASRMEAFADLETLLDVVDELQSKGLVIALTPPGRGQTFAHALYEFDELQKIRGLFGAVESSAIAKTPPSAVRDTPEQKSTAEADSRPPAANHHEASSEVANVDPAHSQLLAQLADQVAALTARISRLEQELGL